MQACTAREFIESHGRRGHIAQFVYTYEAQFYGIRADLLTAWAPRSKGIAESARTAATLVMIAFPDLREVQ